MYLKKEKLIDLINYLLLSNNNEPNYLFSDYEFTDNDIKFTNKTNEYFESDDIKSFRNLLNNYISNMKQSDNYTNEELKEINNFLNKLSKKDFFKHICREISTDTDTFRKFIRNNLFNLTSVGKNNSINNTCAFEHIFLGEFYDDNEKGFHNWIQFYLKKNLINNFKFIKQINFDKLSIVEFGMRYDGKTKYRSSMIIGIHPMIEICIYTLIYLHAFSNNLESLNFDLNDSIRFQLYTVNVNKSFRTCYPLIKVNTSNNLPSNNLPSNNLPSNNLPSNNTNQVKNELESKLAKTESKLEETKSNLEETKSNLAKTESNLEETKSNLEETKSNLEETKSKLEETESNLEETKSNLEETKSKLAETKSKLEETESKLAEIKKIVS
jgi:methyl-accepting chemotaxis protein